MRIWKAGGILKRPAQCGDMNIRGESVVPIQPSPEMQASIDEHRKLYETRQRIMNKLHERLEAAIDQGRFADAGHLAGAIGNLNRH